MYASSESSGESSYMLTSLLADVIITERNLLHCAIFIFVFLLFQIAKLKVPRHIHFVEGFPLTVTGKVQKFKIRTEATRLLGKDISDV